MGYRIVIGDDESIIRMDLCEMLEDAGHTVVGEAADGLEALELVRKESRTSSYWTSRCRAWTGSMRPG